MKNKKFQKEKMVSGIFRAYSLNEDILEITNEDDG